MPDLTRRTLLAGAAATGALAATAVRAQDDKLIPAPDLTGKAILITGCSSGFGRLAAEHFARAGATVFATMRNTPRPEAEELMQLARDESLDIRVMRLDVLIDHEVADAVANAEREIGRGLDVLVNNAGIGITGPVEVQDMEATKLAFDTNVLGYHRLARAVLPGMRARRAHGGGDRAQRRGLAAVVGVVTLHGVDEDVEGVGARRQARRRRLRRRSHRCRRRVQVAEALAAERAEL